MLDVYLKFVVLTPHRGAASTKQTKERRDVARYVRLQRVAQQMCLEEVGVGFLSFLVLLGKVRVGAAVVEDHGGGDISFGRSLVHGGATCISLTKQGPFFRCEGVRL